MPEKPEQGSTSPEPTQAAVPPTVEPPYEPGEQVPAPVPMPPRAPHGPEQALDPYDAVPHQEPITDPAIDPPSPLPEELLE